MGHRLFDVRLGDYQQAVDWMKCYIARFGYLVLDVVLDPDAEMWRFHVEDSVVNVPHELVQRCENVLDTIHNNDVLVKGRLSI